MRTSAFLLAAILNVILVTCTVAAPPSSQPVQTKDRTSLIESYLFKGDLVGAQSAVEKALAADKGNDNLRFQLGTVQFLRGVERMTQSLYVDGLRDHGGFVPFLRHPMGQNPSPQVASYQGVRKIIQAWLDDLAAVDKTLEPIRSYDVKMPLHFALIRLDLNGDGKADESEALWQIFAAYSGVRITSDDMNNLLICFDAGDAVWLRGYCHLLSAMCEVALAHDFKELFERAGNILFQKIETPHDCLKSGKSLWNFGGDGVDIMDAIAFIHCINLPVGEPERMRAALEHLRMMVKLSRRTWDLIEEETDDDHEWLPRPDGQSSVTGATMTPERLRVWREFLDDVDEVLAGKRLLPHPRLPADRGINFRRVFTEPRTFDLVLWIQGTAATPYIEKGRVANPESWARLEGIFEGRFSYYALWFN